MYSYANIELSAHGQDSVYKMEISTQIYDQDFLCLGTENTLGGKGSSKFKSI